MIDSTGTSAIRANGTVLDLLPVGRVITLIAALLVVLFTIVKPEASNGLSTTVRFLFWSLHVGVGLIALWFASRWLAHREYLPDNVLLAVLLTGCLGVVVATPGYLLLDSLFTGAVIDSDPEPVSPYPVVQLLGELQEVAPWFMVVWVVINLPVLLPALLPQSPHRINNADDVEVLEQDGASHPADVPSTARAIQPSLKVVTEDGPATGKPTPAATTEKFLVSLPGVVGTDVIAVSSDLHYLNVWTTAGRTTVLGNLRDVASDLGDSGMQVHRSHWVSHTHVRRIVGTASNAACIMSNQLRIPVSRRRWKSVREQYGRGVLHPQVSVETAKRN